MASVSKITHEGKEIVFVDLSNSDKASVLETIKASEELIRVTPDNSTLVLTDMTGSKGDSEVTDAFKQWAAGNKPYVKLSALVGLTGTKKLLVKAVKVFTGRKNLELFSDKEKALAWLVQ
jgi:hypothetical protein